MGNGLDCHSSVVRFWRAVPLVIRWSSRNGSLPCCAKATCSRPSTPLSPTTSQRKPLSVDLGPTRSWCTLSCSLTQAGREVEEEGLPLAQTSMSLLNQTQGVGDVKQRINVAIALRDKRNRVRGGGPWIIILPLCFSSPVSQQPHASVQ